MSTQSVALPLVHEWQTVGVGNLWQQATNNTKEQFANSPDLKTELMSTQALNSITVQGGLKDILLNHAGLYETLRGHESAV